MTEVREHFCFTVRVKPELNLEGLVNREPWLRRSLWKGTEM